MRLTRPGAHAATFGCWPPGNSARKASRALSSSAVTHTTPQSLVEDQNDSFYDGPVCRSNMQQQRSKQ
ncbi:hypothetical protein B566_EDAN008620 [Ephemera danica]|nr:hypothetical protein B566_EDAN008620 [Ephemera danica]